MEESAEEKTAEERVRITEQPELAAVLGELDDGQKAGVQEKLEATDALLPQLPLPSLVAPMVVPEKVPDPMSVALAQASV
jgi:hypothetical protein